MKQVKKIFDIPVIKIIFKVISWIVLSLLIALAALLVYYVVTSKIYELKGKSFQPNISLFTIISPSMEPNINVYDVVVTTKVNDPSTIKVDDVITFVSSSSLGEGLTITHRVKEIIKTDNDIKFRTKGDNNPIPDSALVSSENVLGKVAFKIPLLGRVQFLLQSKGGWIFALLIPALGIVIIDVMKVIRLSDVKQRVNKTVKEQEEDVDLTNKKNNLKKELQQKHSSAIVEQPNMYIEEFDKEPKDESKVEFVEHVNGELDLDRIKNNIKNLNEEELDVNKIMSNINKLNDSNEDLELPKTK